MSLAIDAVSEQALFSNICVVCLKAGEVYKSHPDPKFPGLNPWNWMLAPSLGVIDWYLYTTCAGSAKRVKCKSIVCRAAGEEIR